LRPLVWALRHPLSFGETRVAVVRAARSVVTEVWGLFVGDGSLAIACLAVVAAVAVYTTRVAGARFAGLMLVAGVILSVGIGLSGAFRAAVAAKPAAEPEPEAAAHREVAAESVS